MDDEAFMLLHEKMAQESGAFQSALGRMSLSWADTEHSIYRTLLHYAKVSDAVGRAIFSGMRAKPMIDAITAILENAKASEARKADFAYIAGQISTIQHMRDMLTHYATNGWASFARPDDRGPPQRQLSDFTRIKRLKNVKIYNVDSEMIGKMSDDLGQIRNLLERHFRKGRFSSGRPQALAWRYKSLQPMNIPKKKPQENPKRQRPPKASPASQ